MVLSQRLRILVHLTWSLFWLLCYFHWGFHLLSLQVVLDADGLWFHQRWLGLFDWVGLHVHWRCLDLLWHQSLIKTLAEGAQRNLSDVDVHVLYLTNDWLVLWVLDSLERTQHREDIFLLFVFINRLHGWVVMLLVTQENVIEKWTFTRQEGASDIQCLDMPVLLFKFFFFLCFGFHEAWTWLDYEPELCGNAEIWYN